MSGSIWVDELKKRAQNKWSDSSIGNDGYDLKELIDINQIPVEIFDLNAEDSNVETMPEPKHSEAQIVHEAVFPNNASMLNYVNNTIGGTDTNLVARWFSYQPRRIGQIIYALGQFMVVKSDYTQPLTNIFAYDCDKFEFKSLDIPDNDIFGGDNS